MIVTILLAALVFLVPANLFLQFNTQSAMVRGLVVDYALPRISIQEIILIGLLLAGLWHARGLASTLKSASKRWQTWATVIAVLALGYRQTQAMFAAAAVVQFGEYMVVGALLWLILNSKTLRQRVTLFFKSPVGIYSLLATVLFQSLVALYQFWWQRSLAGYWFLGEGNMQAWTGLSRVSWGGAQLTAPMGTTAHPNILAGVLVVYLILSWAILLGKSTPPAQGLRRVTPLFLGLTTGLALLAITATQSVSATMGLTLGTGGLIASRWLFSHRWQKLSKNLQRYLKNVGWISWLVVFICAPIMVSLLAAQPGASDSLTRRAYLNQAGWQMWLSQPLTGVGLQNSAAQIEQYSQVREIVRFVQPPHHAGITLLAETGLLGVLVAAVFIWQMARKGEQKIGWIVAAALLPMVSFDHYAVTIDSGRMLVLICLLAMVQVKGSEVAETD